MGIRARLGRRLGRRLAEASISAAGSVAGMVAERVRERAGRRDAARAAEREPAKVAEREGQQATSGNGEAAAVPKLDRQAEIGPGPMRSELAGLAANSRGPESGNGRYAQAMGYFPDGRKRVPNPHGEGTVPDPLEQEEVTLLSMLSQHILNVYAARQREYEARVAARGPLELAAKVLEDERTSPEQAVAIEREVREHLAYRDIEGLETCISVLKAHIEWFEARLKLYRNQVQQAKCEATDEGSE